MTRLSIITINKNNAEGLRRTIESVASQTVPPFEFIIIDGASTDSSIEIIKKYQQHITFWSSENDLGIYDAMNKGILLSHGEYLLFLNSGDTLYGKNIIDFFYSISPSEDIVYGNTEVFKGNKHSVYGKKPYFLKFRMFDSMFAIHQSMFFKHDTFDKYGIYSLKNKIVSDYEHILKILFNKGKIHYLDVIISAYTMDGISSTKKELRHSEIKQVRKKYYSPFQHFLLTLFFEIPRNISVLKKDVFLFLFGKDCIRKRTR